MSKRPKRAAYPKHQLKLDSIRGVATEQGRIYRLAINEKITTATAARLAYILREVRCSLEAVPPEPQAQPGYRPPVINLIEVPHNHFISEDELRRRSGLPLIHTIEHQPENSPILERAPADARDGAIPHGLHLVHPPRPEPQSEAEEHQIINGLKDEISELARKLGVSLDI